MSASPTGAAIHQPSVAVALSLANILFSREVLIRFDPGDMGLLSAGLPPLQLFADYLIGTFQDLPQGRGCRGWCSDRINQPKRVESWINALVARTVNTYELARRAQARLEVLTHFTANYQPSGLPSGRPRAAKGLRAAEVALDLYQPETITSPIDQMYEMISPIHEARRRMETFERPQKGLVSVILGGPPGSGKTFLVKRLAERVGWPLVSLHPGPFIEKGIELIESQASKIFRDLMQLDHVIVFLDECDELFLERVQDGTSESSAARNILSFATASMLPKLQDLHDERRVLIVLGTNYVNRIDQAVRREGRFDRIIFLDRPHSECCGRILRKICPDAQIDRGVARSLAGWSTASVIEFAERMKDQSHISRTEVEHLEGELSIGVENYVKWLVNHGEPELVATGIPEVGRREFKKRWKRLGVSPHDSR